MSFTLDGRTVDAPGFTKDQFVKALSRAAVEGLRVEPGITAGTVDVINGNKVYQTTRSTCSCPAGRHERPCKHRAYACFLFDGLGIDITKKGMPARTDRRWTAQTGA